MKTYQCHKRVKAARILSVPDLRRDHTNYVLRIDSGGAAPFIVKAEWMYKHKPAVGGYLVQYEDGYLSYSPANAFEDGYTEVKEGEASVDSEGVSTVQ